MRRKVLCICAAVAVLAPGAVARAAAHDATGTTPSGSSTAEAVSQAESSTYLWATINVCTDKGSGGTIGVRGEMPTLGFAAKLSMTITLQRYSTTTDSYTTIPGSTATSTVSLGRLATGVHQSGAEFPFTADPGRVDALVTFTWTRGAKVIGTTSQTTTAGHPSAAYGVPAHHSAASCTLGAAGSGSNTGVGTRS